MATVAREQGCITVRVTAGWRQSVDDARQLLATVVSLAAGKRLPLMVDLRKAVPLDPEVRQVYTGPEVETFRALALLVDTSPFGRVMGSFYLRVARLGTPTQIFTDEAAARAWLAR
ncbi:MAG TPA: hypothetical protein VM686_33275 [Polyangiaceae bacterium]|jgi:hypothetical protein|nr:hypothetical protein [Polyangiaceae bacterium]